MDLHALFKNCGDAVIVADDNYQIIFSNSKAKQLFQADYAVLLTATIDSACRLLHVDPKTETKAIACPLRQAVDGEQCCDREFQFQTPTSTSDIWLSITSFPIQMTEPSWRGGLVIIRDITKLKHVAHQKLRNALRDELTDLVSRAAFMDRVGHALKRIQHEADFLVAVLCVDINRLRSINDALGYEAGDQLLVQFATRLTRCFRSEDIVSRLGGDEFTILLEGVSSSLEAMDFARKIHRIMAQSFYLSGTEIPVEVSIGIAFGGIDCQHPEVLLKRANLAMYEAKRDFGERCCIFESSMQGDTPGSLHLEMALRKAITNHEFFLEYQPIFQVTTRQIIGLESLVRWHHPQEGKMPPSQFIPLAEKTGLIVPLGWWILKESCRQMKIWQNQMPYMDSFFVSVNMSSKQFSQEDVVQRIAAILEEVGLDARSLKIEITEGVLIEHSSSIIEKLQAIRDLGITLSIDDFGTGYSSLSYLHRFPVDTLKIDRSFIENADADYEKLEILQSVVRLAWNLGLEVVAEGIETEQHYARIRALRCESGQGFLFSKPLSAVAISDLIQAQQNNHEGIV
ncbi:MAG: EAL domain-containing protein [Cyanobacteria bacterium P01_F01_bin.86]